jgi:phenylalanyl-tRNA synthetase beta chain
MKVSLNWLQEYVDMSGLTAQDIASALTRSGLEVESIEQTGGCFEGVIVARTLSVEQHPQADRLKLVTVEVAPGKINQVVCGASNVVADMWVAYAPLGAKVLSKKDKALFELTPVTIRGVASTGMICSADELGLADSLGIHIDGIWPLDAYASQDNLGQPLEELLEIKADTILETAPTANRGDLMSMRGIAREVAALFNRPLFQKESLVLAEQGNTSVQITLESQNADCTYYSGAILSHIKIQKSPDWLTERLINAGIRSVNNVVDITNYVMLELGQPLHAFDAKSLMRRASTQINVRPARSGETLTTLDGETRTLSEQSILITADDQPVALAGVMGGQSTQITEDTETLFLECAYFKPASNRRSARSVGLRTDASARFERGCDESALEYAFSRAIELLQAHAEAQIESIQIADHRQRLETPISLRLARIEKIIGMTFSSQILKQVLNPLGFQIQKENDHVWEVMVPSYRAKDVSREIDLLEEIVRIVGFDSVPYTLPVLPSKPVFTPRQRFMSKLRLLLQGQGFNELMAHSLLGEGLLKKTGLADNPEKRVEVLNANSQDHTILRQSLLPGLLEIATHNFALGNEVLWGYELGKSYFHNQTVNLKHAGVEETLYLGLLLMGHPSHWAQTIPSNFYTLKGVVESLLLGLGIQSKPRWSDEATLSILHPGQCATLKLGKTPIGFLGALHPKQSQQLKIRVPLFIAEFNVDALFEIWSKQSQEFNALSLSQYPAVSRDIAFQVPVSVTHHQIRQVLQNSHSPLVVDFHVFDEYKGEHIDSGSKSLAFRFTLRSAEKTLTEQEIDETMQQLKRQLETQLPVTYR